MSENYTSKRKDTSENSCVICGRSQASPVTPGPAGQGICTNKHWSISRWFLLSEILHVRSSGFWQHILNKIGEGKNPIARINLNILVNAYMGNSCLKALSMCLGTWALGQEELQLQCQGKARMCQDVLGIPGAPLCWQKTMSPKQRKHSVWQASGFMELLSNFDGFHLCFCMDNSQVRLGLKGMGCTGARNTTLITQRVCAQWEALLERDHKYSKKHFPDTHLGILIMNKCL